MRAVKSNKFIVYGTSTATGVDFVDGRVYDRRGRGYVPSPDIKTLLEEPKRIKKIRT